MARLTKRWNHWSGENFVNLPGIPIRRHPISAPLFATRSIIHTRVNITIRWGASNANVLSHNTLWWGVGYGGLTTVDPRDPNNTASRWLMWGVVGPLWSGAMTTLGGEDELSYGGNQINEESHGQILLTGSTDDVVLTIAADEDGNNNDGEIAYSWSASTLFTEPPP